MLEQRVMRNYLAILREELVPATGCTEPIAIAYCAATLRQLLGELPQRVEAVVSGNILKNVKSVVVPNTGGRKGIRPAIAVGLVAGDPGKNLQVIAQVTPEQQERLADYLLQAEIDVTCGASPCPLDIDLRGWSEHHTARVRITNHHTNIVYLERDSEILRQQPGGGRGGGAPDGQELPDCGGHSSLCGHGGHGGCGAAAGAAGGL